MINPNRILFCVSPQHVKASHSLVEAMGKSKLILHITSEGDIDYIKRQLKNNRGSFDLVVIFGNGRWMTDQLREEIHESLKAIYFYTNEVPVLLNDRVELIRFAASPQVVANIKRVLRS